MLVIYKKHDRIIICEKSKDEFVRNKYIPWVDDHSEFPIDHYSRQEFNSGIFVIKPSFDGNEVISVNEEDLPV
jgi:hypothetical protein